MFDVSCLSDCLSYSASAHVLSRRCYGKQRCKVLVNNRHSEALSARSEKIPSRSSNGQKDVSPCFCWRPCLLEALSPGGLEQCHAASAQHTWTLCCLSHTSWAFLLSFILVYNVHVMSDRISWVKIWPTFEPLPCGAGLGLCPSTAGDIGSILVGKSKILHATKFQVL